MGMGGEETWHGWEKHILHPSGDGLRALATVFSLTALALLLNHFLQNGCGRKQRALRMAAQHSD